MTTKPSVTIHVRQEKPGKLTYAIVDAHGSAVAEGSEFPTICKLEAELVDLRKAAQEAANLPLQAAGDKVDIRVPGRRKSVEIRSRVDIKTLQFLMAGLPDAMIIDERPIGRRRTDLSGPLCELNH